MNYQAYLNEVERLSQEEAKWNQDMGELFSLYESVSKNLLDIQDKSDELFVECELDDPILKMYEEAEEQAATQKKGILEKIVGAIRNLWTSILGIFKKSKEEIPPEELEKEIEIPEEFDTDRTNILNFWKNIKNGISKITTGTPGGFSDLLKGLAIPVLAIGGGALTGKMIKKKKSQIITDTNQITGIQEELEAILQKITGVLSMIPGADKVLQTISNFSSKIKSWISSALGFVKGHNPIAKHQKVKKRKQAGGLYAADDEAIKKHERAVHRYDNVQNRKAEAEETLDNNSFFNVKSNLKAKKAIRKANKTEKNFKQKGQFLTKDLTKLADKGKTNVLYTHQNGSGKFEFRKDGKWYQKYGTGAWTPYKGTPDGFSKDHAVVVENTVEAWLELQSEHSYDGEVAVFDTVLPSIFGISVESFGDVIQEYESTVLEYTLGTACELIEQL